MNTLIKSLGTLVILPALSTIFAMIAGWYIMKKIKRLETLIDSLIVKYLSILALYIFPIANIFALWLMFSEANKSFVIFVSVNACTLVYNLIVYYVDQYREATNAKIEALADILRVSEKTQRQQQEIIRSLIDEIAELKKLG